MILLDTNVLIYSFQPQSPFHRWAYDTLQEALLGSGAAANPVVLSELMVGDADPTTVISRLQAFGVHLLDLPVGAAPRCAIAYEAYLQQRKTHSGPPAPKLPLPDFFIGAHASLLALPIATADIGRYQTYFPEVPLITP